MISHGIGWLIAELLITATWRFFAGQVVLRRPGRYDARYRTWAAPVPDGAELTRTEGIPRSTWARRPGWQRQVVRIAFLAVVWGLLVYPTATVVLLVLGAVPVVASRIVSIQTRRHYAPVVAPWWRVVAESVGHPLTRSPMEWVNFGSGVVWEPWEPLVSLAREDGPLARLPRLRAVVARIAVPIREQAWATRALDAAAAQVDPATSDDERGSRLRGHALRVLAAAIRGIELVRSMRRRPRIERVALEEADARFSVAYPAAYLAHSNHVKVWADVITERVPGEWEYHNEPERLRVMFEHPDKMPDHVAMSAEVFAAHKPTEIPIGQDSAGAWVRIPLKDKTPHVSGAASTGWGKTTTANVMAAHLLSHGWHGLLLDPKRVGFVGAFRDASPHVELRTSLPGQLLAIEQAREEMNRRYELIERYLDRVEELGLPSMKDNPELYFQPLFMLEDEKGSFTVAVKTWWKREGGGINERTGLPIAGKGDPEPLIAEQEILWRGRAAAVHMLTFAQQNNLNVFLSSDMRDQYMFRILSGPQTQSSWIMTYPGTRKRAIASRKGRAVYGVGPEELRDFQLGVISDGGARECARAGVEAARRTNIERARRLAQVTGQPMWTVSPLPFWVPVPADMLSNVPGQDTEGDTTARLARGSLSLVKSDESETAGEHTTGDSGGIVDLVEGDDGTWFEALAEDSADDAAERDTEPAGRTTSAAYVCGIEAAAAFLGITKAAMEGRMKRVRKGEAPDIPGRTHIGRSVAFPKVALLDWHGQFRGKASGE